MSKRRFIFFLDEVACVLRWSLTQYKAADDTEWLSPPLESWG